jgi:hypothetical protein
MSLRPRPSLCIPRQYGEHLHSIPGRRSADGRLPSSTPSQPKKSAKSETSAMERELKQLEAGGDNLADHPALRDEPPKYFEEKNLDGVSENVQQLIREADRAFRTVGNVIAEAREVSQNFNVPIVPIRPPPPPPEQRPAPPEPSPPPRVIIRKSDVHKSTTVITPIPSPTRKPSVTKNKRRKSKKQRRGERPRKQGAAKKQSTRWTISENVAEIFSGQFFKRIEADEMITPDRIQALTAKREEAELLRKKSAETIRSVDSDGSETPIEPFHLNDLPTRIRAAGVKTTITPIDNRPPPLSFDTITRRDFSVDRAKSGEETDLSTAATEADYKLIAFPSPPLKNPARYLNRPQMAPMTPIPELQVTTPDNKVLPAKKAATAPPNKRKNSSKTISSIEDYDYILLKSTPYSVTMPSFRHGPIRFSRTDVPAPDDTLDWTAFQMAILGGAGDWYTGSSDYTQRSEADEYDDLAEWFDGFGFESPGLLVPNGEEYEGSPSTAEYSPVSSTATDDLPIPVAQEYPNGFWNEGNYSTTGFSRDGCAIKRWTVEGHPKRYHRESIESLPQSPMLDLMVGAPTPIDLSNDLEVVPMGYNLGHDLGDFLKWEAQHVYAAAFFGSD